MSKEDIITELLKLEEASGELKRTLQNMIWTIKKWPVKG
jgi:hypothetical protein